MAGFVYLVANERTHYLLVIVEHRAQLYASVCEHCNGTRLSSTVANFLHHCQIPIFMYEYFTIVGEYHFTCIWEVDSFQNIYYTFSYRPHFTNGLRTRREPVSASIANWKFNIFHSSVPIKRIKTILSFGFAKTHLGTSKLYILYLTTPRMRPVFIYGEKSKHETGILIE